MKQKIKNYIEENHLIEPGDTLLLGVSGGADSVALLLLMQELYGAGTCRLEVIHVQHHLRQQAEADAVFTERLCEQMQIPCQVVHVQVKEYAEKMGYSLEEAARMLRYEAFAQRSEALGGSVKILVAHHQEDQAETVLFHLFRGSGLRGLGGIAPRRGQIIRPLLPVTRGEIEAYLANRQQAYCTDETNADLEYTRNRIRHALLPVAEEVHRGATGKMCEAARELSQVEDFIQSALQEQYESCVRVKHTQMGQGLEILEQPLSKLHPYLQQRLIHQVLCELATTAKDIGRVHIKSLEELRRQQVGRQISLPYGIVAVRVYEGIYLSKKEDAALDDQADSRCAADYIYHFDLQKKKEGEIRLVMDEAIAAEVPGLRKSGILRWRVFPNGEGAIERKQYTKFFDYDTIKDSLVLRTRREGDEMVITRQGNKQMLKNYFVNEKIPMAIRPSLPILACGPRVIWVLGYRRSLETFVTEKTKWVVEIEYCPEKSGKE